MVSAWLPGGDSLTASAQRASLGCLEHLLFLDLPLRVCLYAFDLLEVYGVDFREQPLEKRKARLARLLQGADPGVRFNEHLGGDGTTAFEHACKLRLEGIVSKRRDFPYRSGRTKSWLKVKNPMSPAMLRVQDGTW